MKKSLMLLFGFGMGLPMAHSAPFSSEEARRVFDESSVNVSTSAKVVGDYLFTEVSWQEDKSATTEDREAQELSALLAAMQNFIAPDTAQCTNSPFCKTLTEWLEPTLEFNVPNVQSFVLKDETNGDQRRQVVALEAKPLVDAKRRAQAGIVDKNSRTESQWAKLLQGAYVQFKTPEEKRKFFVLLGCPLVNFIADKGSGDYGSALPGCESGWAELEKIRNWRPSADSFYAEYPNLLWSAYAKRTDAIFFPAWSENDGGRLDEAAKLYRQGKDIPTIIRLLAESISLNPINSTKWEYLGGVLKVSNKPCDAVIAYIQALKINPKSQWAWKGLVDSLDKAGFKANAAGLRWYLKIKGN